MRRLILFNLVCSLAACTTIHPAGTRLNNSAARDWIADYSRRKGGATFVSHGGRMYGTDCDAQITFAGSKQVEITEFGYSVETYKGTFSVDAVGGIHVTLQGYHAQWPSMYLYHETQGTFLFPTIQSRFFEVDRRAGTPTALPMASYWPFRYKES
jgi:hypothetical protein